MASLIVMVSFISGCSSSDIVVDRRGSMSAETSPTIFTGGVVAADHPLGSQAGAEMLRLGGNAVDAAVATSFCQAVVRPYSCGLGGGGFMMIRLAPLGRDANEPGDAYTTALVYRETAPQAVGPNFYSKLGMENGARFGPYASGVPGTVAGLITALDTFGNLDRATVLGPAIRAAENGFTTDAHYVEAAKHVLGLFDEHPEDRERIGEDSYAFLMKRFLSDGHPRVGDRIVQPELAKTLREIAKYGESAFYAGGMAEAIATTCPPISIQDMERYQTGRARPLERKAFGYTFLTMPPPSSGGVAMQQILGILERHWDEIKPDSPFNAEYAHLLIEAMKHAFADRAEWLADDRFAEVPIDRLTSSEYIDDLSKRFDPERTFGPEYYGSRRDLSPPDHGTSHISVIDRWGNAVACTETINLEFGSLVVIPEYGIVMNNEMDDFLTTPGEPNAFGLTQSDRNLPAPGKWPLSSMSPTIVIGDDGQVVAVAGASGGPRIITGTLQVLINTLLFSEPVHLAVAQPRLHHQWMPNVVYVEDAWTDDAVLDSLRSKGHEIRRRTDIGNVQIIRRAMTGDGYTAASDPRKGGAPAGLDPR